MIKKTKYLKFFFSVFILLQSVLYAKVEKSIHIDLTKQRVYALEDNVTVLEGRISSGKAGHETPTGIFSILQKESMHRSNIYPAPSGGAKMPYMMRLTWDGVAMHQGYVPRRPASHGCIRLQRRFAKVLYKWAEKGILVNIDGNIDRYDHRDMSAYTKDQDGYYIMEVY